MTICAQCGNDYANVMTIELRGKTLSFDSFECAIQRLAPTCGHCGCRVIGHGIETDTAIYCCAHCAEHQSEPGAIDHL